MPRTTTTFWPRPAGIIPISILLNPTTFGPRLAPISACSTTLIPLPPNNEVNNQDNQLHLVRLLTDAGKTWRSYQEDIDLTMVGGQLTNVVLPKDQWTVPLDSFSGNFASGVNQFNGSTQFNYAAKHNPQVFFTDSNGGDDTTPSNPLS